MIEAERVARQGTYVVNDMCWAKQVTYDQLEEAVGHFIAAADLCEAEAAKIGTDPEHRKQVTQLRKEAKTYRNHANQLPTSMSKIFGPPV